MSLQPMHCHSLVHLSVLRVPRVHMVLGCKRGRITHRLVVGAKHELRCVSEDAQHIPLGWRGWLVDHDVARTWVVGVWCTHVCGQITVEEAGSHFTAPRGVPRTYVPVTVRLSTRAATSASINASQTNASNPHIRCICALLNSNRAFPRTPPASIEASATPKRVVRP